jgi:hypothetical protein
MAEGSWLNIFSSRRLWTSSRRSSATRVRSPASRDGDHCTEASRSCSMASLNGYMAWPGRAAAEAMVAGARTSAAASTTAAHPAAHVPAAGLGAAGHPDHRGRAVEDLLQVPVGHRRVQPVGGQLGPEGVGRLGQRAKLVGELDRTPVQQGVELVVEPVRL